jgi:hypothetical protein
MRNSILSLFCAATALEPVAPANAARPVTDNKREDATPDGRRFDNSTQ